MGAHCSTADELNRRLGMARADSSQPAKIWKPTTLTTAKKLRIFDSCVASQMMYGIQTIMHVPSDMWSMPKACSTFFVLFWPAP